MTDNNRMQVVKDEKSRTLHITRRFDASIQTVWRAWTEAGLLDLWWAPRPWKTRTSKLKFENGGQWLYAMMGPDGSSHWVVVDFDSIIVPESFAAVSHFCDENGLVNSSMPTMYWHNTFSISGNGTILKTEIRLSTDSDFETILAMGFEAGFTMGLNNLDEWLASPALTAK